MRIVLIGHGKDMDTGETFVPDNTTVSFFATYGDNIRGDHVMQILASGSLDDPAEVFPARSSIATYRLSPMSSTELQRELTAAATGGIEPVFVQEPWLFCTAGCHLGKFDRERTPDEVPAVHDDACTGLLKHYAGHDIVFLACRGADGDAGVTEVPEDLDDWVTGWVRCIDASGRAGEGFAEAFDRLPQHQQAQLLNTIPIRTWSYVRHAVQWIDAEGPEPFLRYVGGVLRDGNEPEALAAYATDSRLQALVDERRLWDLNLETLKEQMAAGEGTPEDLWAEIQKLETDDPMYLRFVLEDPKVAEWVRQLLR